MRSNSDMTLRFGLTGPLMTMLLLSGCGSTSPTRVVPSYTKAQFEAIIRDEKTCGPAAKQALYDWAVLIAP